ncbi:MAG: SDR family NAD(P)-dependent oxidoreductase [Gammaproteobacteria bacterium]|nr:MAG: SDR family NAD(P)-dependent oxidoreductase [Gammaproteobacteria bacterium]
MKKRITPGCILITGAGGDIGSALALSYAKPGNILALTDIDTLRLKKISDLCSSAGANVISAEIDVTQSRMLADWIIDVDNQYPIDLVIANAGIVSSIGNKSEPESWKRIKKVFDTNLYGVLATVTPLINRMQERKKGQIAIMSSLSAYRGLPLIPAYSASKASLKVYGEALRGALAKDNIGVSVICPGFIKSLMSDQFPGPKPFMLSAEQAANIIVSSLSKNQARVSFPFPLNLGAWFYSIIPAGLSDLLLNFSAFKKLKQLD